MLQQNDYARITSKAKHISIIMERDSKGLSNGS